MTKHTKKNSKLLIIVSFLISLALCLSVADFCSNVITINAFTSVSNVAGANSYSLYAISLNTAQTQTTAKEYSISMQKQNGAGFVWKQNDSYFVLASAYIEENDANLVKENLEKNGYSPTIIKITVNEIVLDGTYSSNELNTIISALTAYKTTFDNLYDISIALDTSVNTENESKLFIADIENLLNKTKLNFEALFNNKLTTDILYIKLSLSSLCEKITELKNFESTNAQTLSSKIKYTYLECVEMNIELSENI